jgi:hypothetical protein
MASLTQQIPKIELEKIVQELPEMIDLDDVMYRLYLFQKIQDGERDIETSRIIPHEQVVERFARKWQS